MKNVIVALMVMLLSACASTGVFVAATGSDAVAVRVVSQLQQADQEEGSVPGWQMPAMAQISRVGVLTVDGDQLEVGADSTSIVVDPGKHSIKLFADDGGMLRFGKLKYEFSAATSYDILVSAAQEEGKDYHARLVERDRPETILKEVSF